MAINEKINDVNKLEHYLRSALLRKINRNLGKFISQDFFNFDAFFISSL